VEADERLEQLVEVILAMPEVLAEATFGGIEQL
jgi:hypothetical protein